MDHIDGDAALARAADLHERLTQLVHATAARTDADPLAQATHRLRLELLQAGGVDAPEEWCRAAIESIRRGEPLRVCLP